jgi:hypothetical protein
VQTEGRPEPVPSVRKAGAVKIRRSTTWRKDHPAKVGSQRSRQLRFPRVVLLSAIAAGCGLLAAKEPSWQVGIATAVAVLAVLLELVREFRDHGSDEDDSNDRDD